MQDDEIVSVQVLTELGRTVAGWVERGDERPLGRWLARELGSDGVPRRLSTRDWRRCLTILAAGRRRSSGWPDGFDEPITLFVLSLLRMTRPDGTTAMAGHEPAMDGEVLEIRQWADWAKWYRGTAIARVLEWWIPRSRQNDEVSPPLPAWSSERSVLAVLRADWRVDGDMLTVEHRTGGHPCSFELRGGGQTWLGPSWTIDELRGASGRPKRLWWMTGSTADRLEWSERVNGVRVTRMAMLLRGRRMALLATMLEGKLSLGSGPVGGELLSYGAGFAVARDVAVTSLEGCRGLNLTRTGCKVSAQVLPIGLPCLPYATERGSISGNGVSITLQQAVTGRRTFLPLLVSWDVARNRKKLSWRVLTVAEKGKIVGPDRAFAARVSWGRDETYVIYRSLAPPAPRSFLGYQTPARFMLGRFSAEGFVEPLVVDV